MSSTASDTPNRVAISQALNSLAAPGGGISTLALDHRDAMRNVYLRAGLGEVEMATMIAAKVRIVDALGEFCSSILLDVDALPCRRPGLPVLMPLEQQQRKEFEGGRLNLLLDDFSAADAAGYGAQGCKLLLYYRADHETSAAKQRELVAIAAEDCHRHGLPLILEPMPYRLEDEDEAEFAAALSDHTVAAAADFATSGADMLKVKYPGSAAACAQISTVADPLRWTLLGGSDVDGETFAVQLRDACEAGASGFIAGRAIWGGALAYPEHQQAEWLAEHVRPIFERLVGITDTYARRLT
jgi:tagatose 1,6-diphosphate aldolase